jgi:hypothetical protein
MEAPASHGAPPEQAAPVPAFREFSWTFQLSESDALEAVFEVNTLTPFAIAQHRKLRRLARKTWTAAAVLAVLFSARYLLPLVGGPAVPGYGLALVFVVVAVAVALVGMLFWQSTTTRNIRQTGTKQAHSVSFAVTREPHTIRLSPLGFRFDGVDYIAALSWKHFSEVIEGDKFILLCRHDASANLLPRAIVGSPDQVSEVVRVCRRWISAVGGGASFSIPSLLRDRDVACPKCKYNLRGLIGTRCPQCQLELNPYELLDRVASPNAAQGAWVASSTSPTRVGPVPDPREDSEAIDVVFDCTTDEVAQFREWQEFRRPVSRRAWTKARRNAQRQVLAAAVALAILGGIFVNGP